MLPTFANVPYLDLAAAGSSDARHARKVRAAPPRGAPARPPRGGGGIGEGRRR